MISVQNLLRPLNGNKTVLVLLCVLLVGIACSATKTGTYLPDKGRPEKQDPLPDKKKQEEETKQQKQSGVPAFENDFHVAVMLPFSLHQTYAPGSREYHIQESVGDYYQGILMALEELREEGIRITLHVYDSRKDSMETVRILAKPEMKEMDLIIGPLDGASFMAASAFSLKMEIPLIAPFTLPDSQEYINPLAFYCSPSLESYGWQAATYLQSLDEKGTILYLSDGSATDKAFMRGFKAAQKDHKLVVVEKKMVAGMSVTPLLQDKDSVFNYVLMPSDQEQLVNNTLRSFRESEDQGIPVQLIGLDTWLSFRDPEMTHWEKLHTLVLTGFYGDKHDTAYSRFYTDFRKHNVVPPGDYALKGYDQMLFFGQALMAFGKYFPAYVLQTEFVGLGSNYYWEKASRVVENRSVLFLEYNQYRYTRMR